MGAQPAAVRGKMCGRQRKDMRPSEGRGAAVRGKMCGREREDVRPSEGTGAAVIRTKNKF